MSFDLNRILNRDMPLHLFKGPTGSKKLKADSKENQFESFDVAKVLSTIKESADYLKAMNAHPIDLNESQIIKICSIGFSVLMDYESGKNSATFINIARKEHPDIPKLQIVPKTHGTHIFVKTHLPKENFPGSIKRFAFALLIFLSRDGNASAELIARITLKPNRDVNISIGKILNEGNYLNLFKGQKGICQLIDGPFSYLGKEKAKKCVMYLKLYRGGDLVTYISNKSNLKLSLPSSFYELLNALHGIHQKKITHCDLKPLNIFVDITSKGPYPVIADFDLTAEEGKGMGWTPGLISPHRWKYQEPCSFQDEIWALGCIFFFMQKGFYPLWKQFLCVYYGVDAFLREKKDKKGGFDNKNIINDLNLLMKQIDEISDEKLADLNPTEISNGEVIELCARIQDLMKRLRSNQVKCDELLYSSVKTLFEKLKNKLQSVWNILERNRTKSSDDNNLTSLIRFMLKPIPSKDLTTKDLLDRFGKSLYLS